MLSEFENLSLGGNNAASSHADPFTHTGNYVSVFVYAVVVDLNEHLLYLAGYRSIFDLTSCIYCFTELTPEQQKTLIDIRRRKTELLLEIQVSAYP